jgi:hypothetical protein
LGDEDNDDDRSDSDLRRVPSQKKKKKQGPLQDIEDIQETLLQVSIDEDGMFGYAVGVPCVLDPLTSQPKTLMVVTAKVPAGTNVNLATMTLSKNRQNVELLAEEVSLMMNSRSLLPMRTMTAHNPELGRLIARSLQTEIDASFTDRIHPKITRTGTICLPFKATGNFIDPFLL